VDVSNIWTFHLYSSSTLSNAFCVCGCGGAGGVPGSMGLGGAEAEFTAAQELLNCMGANVVYCGQVGTGQVRALA